MQAPTITKMQVVPLLLEACPTARRAWQAHVAWWEGEEAGAFNDVSVFARHIVDSYAKGLTAECDALFAAIERILAEGDQEAQSLAAIGVLEDIQTLSSYHSFGPSAFVGWLGPRSREAWEQIDVLWRAGGGSLAGVIRLEKSLASRKARRRWWQFWKPTV